ncbi:type 2 isopentenyl-diphosphate Delta-isomerase [Paenibacillus sp. BSR1-1]|uniref:type 2 isopentenyl-diphosphate Delta-isomerase n=1 Tax=Paenibacillus sp. BSR1-1 TaxID=3020845 RepID=UPI0025B092FA|nr:type 2 isopentenyl-diphosphate Delta-isomerase [Paenibacillus sp. BSR1-1]MDN3016690.1 type 2 isopentenyl-diphosphate Delta-isomerase [Paenibacillus sp. BSR1-1]
MSRSERKWDHIRFALENGQDGSSAFENIKFIHQSLPNINVLDVRLDHSIGELYLSSPIFINAMTGGGGEKTYRINKELAMVAKHSGLAMAVGSQMAALKDKTQKYTYEIVRKENPDGVLIANLGSEATPDEAKSAIDMIEANAIQIHLNVIQELTMPEGDRDFTGALKRIEAIVKNVEVPVIVKEVGFGMSMETVRTLNSVGVTVVDCGGFGGTNFADIENRRREKSLSFFADWGIPTPISIIEASSVSNDISIIGSGGFNNGIDMVKGLAIGADAIGIAGYFLRILVDQGVDSLMGEIETLHKEMIMIMTALGARTIADLKRIPLIITGETCHWLNQRGIDTRTFGQRTI